MMLEADVLCSRIAIVARGALKVIGSQQHLKVSHCAPRIFYQLIHIVHTLKSLNEG